MWPVRVSPAGAMSRKFVPRVAAGSATALVATAAATATSVAGCAWVSAPSLLRGAGSRAASGTTRRTVFSQIDGASNGFATSMGTAALPFGAAACVTAALATISCRQVARRTSPTSTIAGVASAIALVRGVAASDFSCSSSLWQQQSRRCASARSASASSVPTLHVGIVGYGLVGKELVGQLLNKAAAVEADLGSKLTIAGVARSSTMVLLPPAGDPAAAFGGGAWPAASEEAVDLNKFGEHLLAAAAATGRGSRALIVDNTASDAPAGLYEAWLAKGVDVVTPNKRAGSGPYDRYERIMAAARSGGSRFLYEATVGAGLPIIGPLQGLVAAGDDVKSVQGIFSGTLSYIFNTWKPGQKFSEVVAVAKDKGFTEPDPRDDLSGTDVARKVTILARELGLKIELADVPVASLVPEKLRDWQPAGGANLGDAFVQELAAFDEDMDKIIEEADAAGEVLRFVGDVDVAAGTASVRLGKFPKDHPFASTQFADNIVTISSKWYDPRPLVVQGPGAGAAVTAAGVFGNIHEVLKGM